MAGFDKSVLQRASLPTWKLGLILGGWSMGLALIASVPNPLFQGLEFNLSVPVQFKIRSMLGKSPELDPRIKLFAVDDKTVAYVKDNDLGADRYERLLSVIAKKRPKKIFIDKIFAFEHRGTQTEYSYKKTLAKLKKIEVPIVVGSFPYKSMNENDTLVQHTPVIPKNVNIERHGFEDFYLPTYIKGRLKKKTLERTLSEINLARARPGAIFYGPHKGIRPVFDHIGHISYSGDGRLAPFLRLDNRTAVPALSTYAADKIEFRGENLYLDEQVVPVDSEGYTYVNYSDSNTYLKDMKNISLILKKNNTYHVNPGDYVFILPHFFTGNTDFTSTPLGELPGSYTFISTINSILTKNWLKPVDMHVPVAVVAVFIGVLTSAYLPGIFSLLVPLLLAALWFALSMMLFSFNGVVMPWMIGMLGLAGGAISTFAEKFRLNEKRSTILRSSLDGFVAPNKLDRILKRPGAVNLDAREQVATVMFIDVVGYSLLAENQVPRVAFDQLKHLLRDVGQHVHDHGGIVNKTLGDGLLCLFGYDFESDSVSVDHAEKAVACAIKIQQENIAANLQAFSQGEQVFPLRIGIHTAPVLLGNLGTEERVDFTAVGNGVNFAKRLEGACEIHSILMSVNTKDLIHSALQLDSRGLKKRMVSIKHYTNLVESYEYDPFFEHAAMRAEALDAYRRCASLARVEQRFTLSNPEAVIVNTTVGSGVIMNYSLTGLSVKLRTQLVKGSTIIISLDSSDHNLGRQLNVQGVNEIRAEVRWVYSDSNGHVHGILFRDFSSEQAAQMVEVLKFYDATYKTRKPGGSVA